MLVEHIFMVLTLQSVIQRQAKDANMGNQVHMLESAMNLMLISLLTVTLAAPRMIL